ncbi:fam-a protein [Plasmodium vinckei vinckei]|uniref:Fam-a protein n=1 Tax=Plasmodium vinckei vinckei TaxID=54757 RepID=A0A081IBU1_PLAVN|nr:fam-a protein [Plasmodium vinckei vinckei]KEG01149.1 hypothetical protein YYE_04184 [Plasmodium vinckei vinckei]VEV54920.1 fam-a protein [Plasmodium vinckei vinckei]
MSKGYIKIIFPLLVSFLYMSNNVLANDRNDGIEALRRFARPPTNPTGGNEGSEESNEQHSSDFYVYKEQVKAAEELMDEAEDLLSRHATNTNEYSLYNKLSDNSIEYFKKYGEATIYKFNHKLEHPDKYNYIVEKIWNPQFRKLDGHTIKEKIVRRYSPDLVMIQHRYTNDDIMFDGYYYALAKKYQISDTTTLITYATPDIDDQNRADKLKFKNPLLESANSFKQQIDSEKDIQNGELTKMFVNLSGYLIRKKEDHVDITFVHSIDIHHRPNLKDSIIDIVHSAQILHLIKLTIEAFNE